MRLDGAPGKVFLCLQPTDMRKSFDGLSAWVQEQLQEDPFSRHWFVFRSKRGDRVKVLAWDGSGLTLFYKRLDEGAFVWPQMNRRGAYQMSVAQLNALLEGMDWRRLIDRATTTPTRAA